MSKQHPVRRLFAALSRLSALLEPSKNPGELRGPTVGDLMEDES